MAIVALLLIKISRVVALVFVSGHVLLMIDIITALFLGFVEGLTEFIPVSSTAHLIVLVQGLGFPAPPGHVFEVFIQLGAILAVMVAYRERLIRTIMTVHTDDKARRFALNLVVGTIPALIAGFIGRDWIKDNLYNHYVIACTLIAGGIIILLVEKKFSDPQIHDVDSVPMRTALLIGCCQTVALIPGVSRSGATIIGALGLGLSRPAAAEFSFFLAVPVMLAAVAYDSLKSWHDIISYGRYELMILGFLAAFMTALLVIKWAIRIVSKYGFMPFAWYRIFAGILIILIFS